MKDMPLPPPPCEIEIELKKGVLDFAGLSPDLKWGSVKGGSFCFVGIEPTSVTTSPDPSPSPTPSPPSSSSTSLLAGGGGVGASTGITQIPTALDIAPSSSSEKKCGVGGMEDYQSIYRWIMGDVEEEADSTIMMGLRTSDFEFKGGGFGVVDHVGASPFLGFVADAGAKNVTFPNPSLIANNPNIPNQQNSMVSSSPLPFNHHQHHQIRSPPNHPPLSFAHQDLQHQQNCQNPNGQIEPNNCMITKQRFLSDSGHAQEVFVQGLPPHHNHLQLHKVNLDPNMCDEEELEFVVTDNHHLQQCIIDQIYNAADMLETGNLVLAQAILARLNHHVSPFGKPFLRSAFYFKEALQLLIHMNTSNFLSPQPSPFSLVYKIGAYKCFSEISPILQFTNFTCTQALLEAVEGFSIIHIVDFDIGFGGQWASLMQELALRNGSSSTPCLKITAFVSATIHDELELSLTCENLNHFASEINMAFELEIVSIGALNSASWCSHPLLVSENESVVVNLPVGSSSNFSLPLPLVLRFVKQLSPKILVSLDRGHDRSDLSFPQHVIYALQSHWTLLESLDAVNVNLDALQKVERFLLLPNIEKIVLGCHCSREKMLPWRTLFSSYGFSSLTFSNFNESQAECVLKRSPVRGFHVEKRHSSLVLCWHQKELISVSAWRC